jgi:hypothetical protein
VLGREPERRRGLRWREPVRRAPRRWRRRGAQARPWTQSGVRRRRLLQIGGCVGRGEREMGGGRLGATWRKENGRERGPRARHSRVDHRVGMALGGTIRGGSACSWQRQAGEQRRAAGRGRRGAGATNRWGLGESKAQRQRRGAGGRGVSEAAGHRQAGPGRTVLGAVQTRF